MFLNFAIAVAVLSVPSGRVVEKLGRALGTSLVWSKSCPYQKICPPRKPILFSQVDWESPVFRRPLRRSTASFPCPCHYRTLRPVGVLPSHVKSAANSAPQASDGTRPSRAGKPGS